MFSKVLVVLAVASAAFATVFVTAPIASTSYAAGKSAVVQWQESGSAPSLADFGPSMISIYVGNAQQQTRLQTLNSSTDVSKVSSINFTPDATIGPNGSEYFIRFESISLKDATQPQFPALAFSAKFALTGMTGVFSADVVAQIQGQSTAPLGPPSVAPATSSGSSSGSASPTTTSSTLAKTASKTPSAAPKPTSNSAMGVHPGWAGAVLGAVVSLAIL
jgi:hypothetical protein